METKMSIIPVLQAIAAMTSNTEIDKAALLRDEALAGANDIQKDQILRAWRQRNEELLNEFRRQGDESLTLLTQNGFVVDTAQWLTIKRYAEKYNVSTQVVTNWISRGTIPTDSTMILAELNNIRLVKDQPYR
ncbi:hypothetical protein [Spirosoma validum]|uniref:Uncharacterized protein n=1 Tax=Spirosoma validum TaxID=2771355 RepID=A0A927GFG5_9BACT|nr:hypothetical protein [Spirosoma validum]MBD2755756.1 hypothetical protein [Spirosoma validum]